MNCNKLAISIQDQIKFLEDRGLKIADKKFAATHLSKISYYRLKGYWDVFLANKTKKTFKSNASFEKLINRYSFDKELRVLLFSAIESIEVSLRAKMTNHLSTKYDPWWFENSTIFHSVEYHQTLLEKVKNDVVNSKIDFIAAHRLKYSLDRKTPPSWKTLEITSINTLSRLYSSINHNITEKQLIAREYDLFDHDSFSSWLVSLSFIRNTCAHHSRLIDRKIPIKPNLLGSNRSKWLYNPTSYRSSNDLFIHICCIKYLLNSLDRGSVFKNQFYNLIKGYPDINLKSLGFTKKWKLEPVWKFDS